MYILAKILAYHLQLKCMGGHFFLGHPYIESTTVLSDIYIIYSSDPWESNYNDGSMGHKKYNIMHAA